MLLGSLLMKFGRVIFSKFVGSLQDMCCKADTASFLTASIRFDCKRIELRDSIMVPFSKSESIFWISTKTTSPLIVAAR